MITHHELTQGSPEWHQFRANHYGASEAAAMLNLSPYTTRSELLRLKSTGIAKEVDEFTQRIFDKGHAVEALARPIAEALLEEDLYPVTISRGCLSASCDGLTMDESIAWECKQFNAKLFESIANGVLPEHHWPQCQQVLYVTGAEKLMFTCSNGTEDKTTYMWVYPDKDQQDSLVLGWNQFAKDLEEYVPSVVVEAPKAEAIMQLPALSIQVNGAISLISNLDNFSGKLKSFIDGIDKEPSDDQGFANIEAAIKVLDKAEKALEQAESAALSQVSSVDDLRVAVAFNKDLARTTRLMLNKLVTSKKESIKLNILNGAVKAYADHKDELEQEIKPIRLVFNNADFAGAMKNKRTLASLRDAVDTELANAKINMDAVAKDIRAKLTWCKENSTGFGFLFNDISDLIYKAEDDFKLVVTTRIEAHKKVEADKLEGQRLQMQAEEEAKAKQKAEEEQAEKLEAERAVIREEDRIKADTGAKQVSKELLDTIMPEFNVHINNALLFIERAIEQIESGFVRCENCGEQEDTNTLDFVDEIKSARNELLKAL